MSMQSVRATFTGVEPYVDVPLDPPFENFGVGAQGITQDDELVVVDYTVTVISSTVARVEPTNLFTGYVDLLLVEIA